jgi:hypothetical protein
MVGEPTATKGEGDAEAGVEARLPLKLHRHPRTCVVLMFRYWLVIPECLYRGSMIPTGRGWIPDKNRFGNDSLGS